MRSRSTPRTAAVPPAAGVVLPQSVQVGSPGGFKQSFPVVPGGDVGGMQALVLDVPEVFTEAVTITLEPAGDGIALGEVSFDGAVLADPALQVPDGELPLPAKRFLGLGPEASDASAIRQEVVFEQADVRFEFPWAVDDFGVQAVAEWSSDLVDWAALPFPRLADLPIAVATDPDDGDVLRISHLNGIAVPEGEAAVLPSGATVLLAQSGQITYRPAPGRTVFHQAADMETFTFTVSDAGGLSATGSAEIELSRVNSAPVAHPEFGPISRGIDSGEITLSLTDLVADAEGSPLRITHVNGQPLLTSETALPSTALISLNQDAELFYDPWGSFVLALDQPNAEDSFTVSIADAAGATLDLPVVLNWTLFEFQLQYRDSRFDSSLGPQTAWIWSPIRFPVDTLVSITDRQTGIRYAQRSHTFAFQQTATFDFDLPAGIDLQGEHFFERFALQIDRPDGVPIYYGYTSGQVSIEPLYSSLSRSFFRVIAPTSPHWPVILKFSAPGNFSHVIFWFLLVLVARLQMLANFC